jgi:sterol 3beta-glucosyltransferase
MPFLRRADVGYPSGIVHILDSMDEGLHNTPRLYGSSVRDKGRVTNFESGVIEGGKVGTFRSHTEMAH